MALLSPAPGGGKTRSARSGSDPRQGVGGMKKNDSYGIRFSSDPHKSGGPMEQHHPDTMTGGIDGPRLGKRSPKPMDVETASSMKEHNREKRGD